LTWVNLLDSWLRLYFELTPKSNFKTIIITTFILYWSKSTRIDPLDTWSRSYPESTHKLSFKIIIIIIFILMLTWVNGHFNLCPESYPKSTFKLNFKIIIIITFSIRIKVVIIIILKPNFIGFAFDQWLSFAPDRPSNCILKLYPYITCFNWIFLKLKVFYNDILKIKNNTLNIKIHFKIISKTNLFLYHYLPFNQTHATLMTKPSLLSSNFLD
jgi:hypothetical protein